jgi:hypothetical protein
MMNRVSYTVGWGLPGFALAVLVDILNAGPALASSEAYGFVLHRH